MHYVITWDQYSDRSIVDLVEGPDDADLTALAEEFARRYCVLTEDKYDPGAKKPKIDWDKAKTAGLLEADEALREGEAFVRWLLRRPGWRAVPWREANGGDYGYFQVTVSDEGQET